MTRNRNPQAQQMGDESMVRNLSYQAEAIWPQEQHLFDRYALAGPLRILDLGCGTGEITRRLARRYPDARIVGVDILAHTVELARRVSADLGDRVRFEQGDAFALSFDAEAFDLVACRHVSQAVPDFPHVLAEITRVLRRGGWLHLLSEDYGMLHFPAIGAFDPDRFWNEHAVAFLSSIGCDGRVGRHSPALLQAAGYDDIAMDYVIVDTLRVPRDAFAGIISAWRDGYTASLAGVTGRGQADVKADFDRMIEAIRAPPHYAVWHVPIASGRKPPR